MIEKKTKSELVLYSIVFFILFLGLISIFANTGNPFFHLEVLGLIILLVLSIVGFVVYREPWGERVFLIAFVLYIANLLLIWYFYNTLYLLLLFIAVMGIVMSIPKPSFPTSKKSSSLPPVTHSIILDEPIKPKTKTPEMEKPSTDKTTSRKTQYLPGKYLASSRSNVYHQAACDWADNINKKNQVWFDSKEDAWEKGYKAHECVK